MNILLVGAFVFVPYQMPTPDFPEQPNVYESIPLGPPVEFSVPEPDINIYIEPEVNILILEE